MLINSGTKIAALIKHHPDALEAIVALSPDFKKLRNPMLRKLMAGRTSIAMASQIGGCKPEDFFEKLKPLGFEIDGDKVEEAVSPISEDALPAFIREAKEEDILNLDVRDMLAEGNDPLKLIQQTVKNLESGKLLRIVNTFEPTPLIMLLGKQGFKSHVQKLAPDHIETYFFKGENVVAATAEVSEESHDDWDAQLARFDGKLQEIDVRHLEMPQPMMNILEALEKLPEGMALYVHHKRIPVFLLSELKDRNFEYRIKQTQEGPVFLLIFRQ
ncbi:MAG: DUF2249 domain-containing protein [Chitinophagaceae bacterium]